MLDPETMQPVPAGRRDHGRDHVPRQHHDEGLPEEPEGDARRRSPAAGSTRATWRCMYPDGYIKIKDRSKDIIISGGENISSHRGRGRAVPPSRGAGGRRGGASPMPKWGETPCAFVELKAGRHASTPQEIVAHCRKHLARLQGAAGGGVRRAAEDLDRQDPEVRAAQAGRLGGGHRRLKRGSCSPRRRRQRRHTRPHASAESCQRLGAGAPGHLRCCRVFKGFQANQGLLLAGAVAYYALLSVVPLLILTVIALSHFVDQARTAARRWAATSNGWCRGSRRRSSPSCRNFLAHREVIGWLLLVTMLFFSSLAFTVLENAMSVIFLHRVAIASAAASWSRRCCPTATSCAGLRAAGGDAGLGQPAGDGRGQRAISSAATGRCRACPACCCTCWAWSGEIFVLTSVYMVMPVGRLWWRHALIGGVTAALLWEITRQVLVWYFATLSQVSVVYGSLTTAIVVLFSLEIARDAAAAGRAGDLGVRAHRARGEGGRPGCPTRLPRA